MTPTRPDSSLDSSPPARPGDCIIHGTAIAVGDRAVVIRGASGQGKSDLALRCLAMAPGSIVTQAPLLVADDRVRVALVDGRLQASALDAGRGLIEVRGVGIVRVPSVPSAWLTLIADLAEPAEIERMPEPSTPVSFHGVQVQRMVITPREPSAPIKLLLALAHSCT